MSNGLDGTVSNPANLNNVINQNDSDSTSDSDFENRRI